MVSGAERPTFGYNLGKLKDMQPGMCWLCSGNERHLRAALFFSLMQQTRDRGRASLSFTKVQWSLPSLWEGWLPHLQEVLAHVLRHSLIKGSGWVVVINL